jgi:hypothetical protein
MPHQELGAEQPDRVTSSPTPGQASATVTAELPGAGRSAARAAAGIAAGDPPVDLVVANRASIGTRAVARILARQQAAQSTTPHSAELEALATDIASATAAAEQLGTQLAGLPNETPKDATQAERAAETRATLEHQLNAAEEELEKLLTRRVSLLDEDMAYLARQAGGNRTDPEGGGDEMTKLRNQRNDAAEALRLVKRRRAKRRIEELTRSGGSSDPKVKDELDRLGRFLASSARIRKPPGSWGKDSKGHGYVVYKDHVKVGGGLPWRNNNPGNVNGKDITEGVIGWNPEGLGFHIFATPEDGAKASGGLWQKYKGMKVKDAIFRYSQGMRKDDPVEAAKQQKAADKYTRDVEKWAGVSGEDVVGSLSPEKFEALLKAVRKKEGEGGVVNPGTIYTCGSGTPSEYRQILGCDE